MTRLAAVLACLSVVGVAGEARAEEDAASLNERIRAAGLRWTAGDNPMSRLRPEERARYQIPRGMVPPQVQYLAESLKARPQRPRPARSLPAAIDWRNLQGRNWVTPIRDQGQCGACWSFATVASVETLMAHRWSIPDPAFDYSEQQLLDCSGASLGCDSGGSTWLLPAGYMTGTGLTTEQCYPYTSGVSATQGSCASVSSACSALNQRAESQTMLLETAPSPWPWEWADPADGTLSDTAMDDIKTNLLERPVGVSMRVFSDLSWYTKGIYQPAPGATKEGLHAVLIVGYDDAGGYWIVKNSWGSWWGEKGYFRIAYNTSNIGMFAYVYDYYEARKDPLFCRDGSTQGGPPYLPTRITLGGFGESGAWLYLANCGGGVLEWTASRGGSSFFVVTDQYGSPVTTGKEVAVGNWYWVYADHPSPITGTLTLTGGANGPVDIEIDYLGPPPGLDAGQPGLDASQPGLDAATPPGLDASALAGLDGSHAGLDASALPGLDASALPGQDAARPPDLDAGHPALPDTGGPWIPPGLDAGPDAGPTAPDAELLMPPDAEHVSEDAAAVTAGEDAQIALEVDSGTGVAGADANAHRVDAGAAVDSGGCGCASTSRGVNPLTVLLVAGLALLRRRRRQATSMT